MNNDLVARFKEKTDKHWHPFMGTETTIEKRDDMAVMTDDDHYIVQIYPKARKATLVFVGGSFSHYNYELTYNTFVAPILRQYNRDGMGWGNRSEIAEGYFEWSWPARVLDIKGDG